MKYLSKKRYAFATSVIIMNFANPSAAATSSDEFIELFNQVKKPWPDGMEIETGGGSVYIFNKCIHHDVAITRIFYHCKISNLALKIKRRHSSSFSKGKERAPWVLPIMMMRHLMKVTRTGEGEYVWTEIHRQQNVSASEQTARDMFI